MAANKRPGEHFGRALYPFRGGVGRPIGITRAGWTGLAAITRFYYYVIIKTGNSAAAANGLIAKGDHARRILIIIVIPIFFFSFLL